MLYCPVACNNALRVQVYYSYNMYTLCSHYDSVTAVLSPVAVLDVIRLVSLLAVSTLLVVSTLLAVSSRDADRTGMMIKLLPARIIC